MSIGKGVLHDVEHGTERYVRNGREPERVLRREEMVLSGIP